MSEKYLSEIGEKAYGYYECKKSKFHCYMFCVMSEQQVEEYLKLIKAKHKKARHCVYAYHLKNDEKECMKFSNDGEPQGTGINATMQVLEKDGNVNYLVVIVRYFGGVLLGSGPLLRSYFNAFKEAYHNRKE